MDSPSNPSNPDARHEAFVRLFVQHQRRILGFISTLLPNAADAEEVLQETSIVAWRKFDQFDLSTDFVRWACSIAKFEAHRKRRESSAGLPFSETLLERLAEEHLARSEQFDARYQALHDCMARLRAGDRDLFTRCYAADVTAKEVAEQLGRPANTVYKALNRIRRRLMDCIERNVEREEREP